MNIVSCISFPGRVRENPEDIFPGFKFPTEALFIILSEKCEQLACNRQECHVPLHDVKVVCCTIIAKRTMGPVF
jgi:hypothetical protein